MRRTMKFGPRGLLKDYHESYLPQAIKIGEEFVVRRMPAFLLYPMLQFSIIIKFSVIIKFSFSAIIKFFVLISFVFSLSPNLKLVFGVALNNQTR